MQLPDEAITYNYQSLLVPVGEEWTAAAELRAKHFLHPNKLKDFVRRVEQAKSQVAAERDPRTVPPEARPVHSTFVDLPQQLLDGYRRKKEASDLGRILGRAAQMRADVDRVVILGSAGDSLGGRLIFEALRSAHHNEMPTETRGGVPRLYFTGDSFDNDSLQDLLDLIQVSCVEPGNREERWGVVVVGTTGANLETLTALRVLRRDATEYYGLRSEWLRRLCVPVTGTSGPLRDLFTSDGYGGDEILTIPDDTGSHFSVFSAAGLLPVALADLDVPALLQGAVAMTRRFLEEPFERNPVLQFAAVNHLMYAEQGHSLRVLAVWSKKLEALGRWYDQLLSSSLGKRGTGPTPLSLVQTRDHYGRGQQQQEGPRDRYTNNLFVKSPRNVPLGVAMADRNGDNLNQYARKTLPDLLSASHQGSSKALWETARPSADIIVPAISEHTMGQLLQMLMLATVVEGKLMSVNPYSETGVEASRAQMLASLKTQPSLSATGVGPRTAGEVVTAGK